MTSPSVESWADLIREVLLRYDEPLLRLVANQLCKPRNQWPVEELIDRCVQTVGNPAVIDRRLADLDPACVQLLALIGRSRQPRWRVGNLVELLAALGHSKGVAPILALFDAGLLYPDLGKAPPVGKPPALKAFDQWLGQGAGSDPVVLAPPEITARAVVQTPMLVPAPPAVALEKPAVLEADGLDFLLRLTALWQQVAAAPLRRTQQRGFFKRDLDRLRADGLLNAAPPDRLTEIADLGLLTTVLALDQGILREDDGELRAGVFPPSWNTGLANAVAGLWSALLAQKTWNTDSGWQVETTSANPYPAAWLLALLQVAAAPAEQWVAPADIEQWLHANHPYWHGSKVSCGAEAFLLGVAYPLRLLQATRGPAGKPLIRLSPLGRWLLGFGPTPASPSFPQTLLVQPNLEILVYRQGLTPALTAQLARLANWKALGAVCTMQLEADSVYRGLEAGETFETIQRTLERHGMKTLPDTVVSSLRTWANKRDRLSVYTAGALFEFDSPEDLNDALSRGLPAVRLGDRLAVVANEQAIDYRHFRLTATRDYALPPERCVDVEADGVTLAVDLASSDLLIETEIRRFAEPLPTTTSGNRRWYRITPETLRTARESGWSLQALETWFQKRTGMPMPAATRLLFLGSQLSPFEVRRQVVLLVPTEEMADGLMQWPSTRELIDSRLGPTALTVPEEHLDTLHQRLALLGVKLNGATVLPVSR